jgi:glycosyltransferase involved in cell wall biosynthesis
MKKVCFLLNNEFLLDNRVEREARTLTEVGYAVTLFCSRNHQTPLLEDRDGLQIHRILPKRLHSYKPYSFRLVKALFQILAVGKRFDVVHVHDCNMLLLGWMLSRLWQAKLVYDSHELWESIFSERKQLLSLESAESKTAQRALANLDRMIHLERRLLPDCDQVISVSQSICHQLDQWRNLRGKSNATTIRNISNYYPLPLGRIYRHFHDFFNLRPEQKVILLQGGLRADRGVFKLISTMTKVGNPDLVLVLMGPAMSVDFHEEFQNTLEQNPQIRERVFYKSPVSGKDLLAWTASANLGIAPILNTRTSYYYCLPNKLFEYIQAELPCATSNFPEMSAVVDEYQLGFTFDPEDTDALAKQLDNFFKLPERAEFYRAQARRAKTILSWENEQKKLLALYQKMF